MVRLLRPLRPLTAALSALLLLLLAMASCDRRPLEVYYMDRAGLMLYVDWTSRSYFDRSPQSMTVHIYDEQGRLYYAFPTNEVDSVALPALPVGRYKLIVFNDELDVFPSFGFLDYADFSRFRTFSREDTRYKARAWDPSTKYYYDPAELLGCAVDSFEVVEQDHELKFIGYKRRNQAVGTTTITRLQETILPLQTVIHINVHVNGLQYMYGLEASLDGMADGCSMAYTWRNPTTCSVLYSNNWNWKRDFDGSVNGWVTLDVATWGEPRGKELQADRDSLDNVLRMNFILTDGRTPKYFEFNVGHLIEYHQPQQDSLRLTPPDVLRHLYLTINREIPLLPEPDDTISTGTGAGFNATVDPWEYGGEIDLGTF